MSNTSAGPRLHVTWVCPACSGTVDPWPSYFPPTSCDCGRLVHQAGALHLVPVEPT